MNGSTAITCHADEPGVRLLLDIRVVDSAGVPLAGVPVSAFNTDASGLYNPRDAKTSEPRLHAQVRTDERGRCQVLTLRPAPYPEGDEPAHIHFSAGAPDSAQSYRTVWFEGDMLLTASKREWAANDAETEIVAVEDVGIGVGVCRVEIRVPTAASQKP